MERPPRRRPAGFSLIELLVVIALIAALAGLLLPAVSQMRTIAKRTVFAGNQRQVAVGMLSYVQDNQGVFMPWLFTDWGLGYGYWFHQLDFNYLETHEDFANPAAIARSLYHDPLDASRTPGGGNLSHTLMINGSANPMDGWPVRGITLRVMASIAHPGELFMLGPGTASDIPGGSYDITFANCWNQWTVAPYGLALNTPNWWIRYKGTAPFTFADGHIEVVNASFFWSEAIKDAYTGTSRFIDTGHTNP